MLLHVEFVLLGLRLVDVDLRQFVLFKVSIPGDCLRSHSDFHLIVGVSALHIYPRFYSFVLLFLIHSHSRLQRVLINLELAFALGFEALFLGLDVRLVHAPQVMVEFLALLKLGPRVNLVASYLRIEELFTLHFVHEDSLVSHTLFVFYGIHAGGFLLHAAKRLLVLGVGLVLGHLVDQVLHSTVL